jgi:hypothetical protein
MSYRGYQAWFFLDRCFDSPWGDATKLRGLVVH